MGDGVQNTHPSVKATGWIFPAGQSLFSRPLLMDILTTFTAFCCFSVGTVLGQRPPYYPASLGQWKQETGTGLSLHTVVKMGTPGTAVVRTRLL